MINVLEYLEKSAAATPFKTAVLGENTQLTYRELYIQSQRMGTSLANCIFPNQPIAVFMEKQADALISFLGIVYAGCFYSFFDSQLPAERLKQMKTSLTPAAVITDNAHYSLAMSIFPKTRILRIEALNDPAINIDHQKLKKLRGLHLDVNPLYINFTSGSTGTPKGIVVSHRSVIRFIDTFTQLFHIGTSDVIGNQAPFDFDVSVKDIYSALSTGATLAIIPMRLFTAPSALIDFICEHRITTLIWAVSALCLVNTFHGLDYRVPASVNKVLFSGETMPQKHLNAWMKRLPDSVFINLYGPSEITCNCTYHHVSRTKTYPDGIPIGKAFPNADVFLLDEDNQKIAQPQKHGEICVRGSGLALGYWNNPQLSNAVFVQNPLHTHYADPIYRTGDLGWYDSEGLLYFAGRKDFQIKYMGHRIELEEIERTMMRLPEVIQSCCIFDSEKSCLSGFYIGTAAPDKLRKHLSKHLPAYMVPRKLIQLKTMPLTKNGKIDRKKLNQFNERSTTLHDT